MKLLIVLFTLLLVTTSCVQKNEMKRSEEGFIIAGKIDSLYSKSLSEERKFWIYLPYGADQQPEPGRKYPVLYLLDGNSHFLSVAGLVHQFSRANGNMLCPEMIVVAIPNTNRTRDLTPTNVASFDKSSGGGDNFTSFLEDLIKHVETNYPATAYRTLIGHSLGGLFVINTLMYHQDLFDNYLAIDPSLWWDDKKLLKASKHLLDSSRFDRKFLYVAMAHTVKRGMTLKQLSTDTTTRTNHMRSIIEFCDETLKKTGNGLTFESKYYPNDGHSTVVLASEHDALRSMFSWYELKDIYDYANDSTHSADQLIETIESHYKMVSDHFGYKVSPGMRMINELGYYLLNNQKANRAFALFTLNQNNYPNEMQVYNAFGDYYLHEKDTLKAVNNFDKALTLKDEEEIRNKLEKLKK